jgi:surface protein
MPTINPIIITSNNIQPPLTPWVRNPEWIAIPDIASPTDQIFYGVIRLDPNRYNGLAVLCQGAYTVDWGDGGTPTNHNSNTKAYYTYDYATVPEVENSEGYKTVLVTITPQSAQNLTRINLQQTSNTTSKNTSYKWLDINFNAPNCTFLVFGSITTNLQTSYLERCRVGVLGSITSLASFMAGFRRLQVFEISENSTASVTTMGSMFSNCSSLQSVPLFNTTSVTNMASMFIGCSSLQSVPSFNTASVTTMGSMFSNCSSLQSVPLFNTTSVTNMASMFSGCSNLQSVPLFTTTLVTAMNAMFSGCSHLQSVPLFDTPSVTNMSNMFLNCSSLQSVPIFNTAAVTNMSTMFNACSSLQSVPLFNTAAVTIGNFGNIFTNVTRLYIGALNGTRFTISYSGCSLGKTQLENIFDYLGTIGTSSQVITISSNWGASTPISQSSTTTTGSTTINITNTANITVGMQVTGIGSPLTTTRAVTLQDTGNTVTLNSHGLENDDEVSFATIVTTTGITANVIYYVVNKTANTFQIATTVGGPPLPLTTNGSGTIRYRTEVVSIVPNTSVTVSRPMTSSGTATLEYRELRTGTALLKGWAVTG